MYVENPYFCDLCEEVKEESQLHLCNSCGCFFCDTCGSFKIIDEQTFSLCNPCLSKIDVTANTNDWVPHDKG